MVRVLLSADAVGGVWTYALDLARGLREAGDEVSLAVLGPAPSAVQCDAAQASGLDLIATGLPLDWIAADAAALARAATGLADIAVARRAQILHLSSPALAGMVAFPMPVVGVAHSCLATWWAAMRKGPCPDDFRWRIAATARGYAACDALIAPSAAFAEATRRAYGVSPIPVHNGRSPSKACPGARDIPIAMAGRLWDEGKGATTLDEAAGLIDAPILALGQVHGPQGQRATLDRLRLAGSIPEVDMAATLMRTGIFVSAAYYEPFGLAVLEAAQVGCALVLSDIDTFRELWDGVAIFVAPGDAAGFAAALTGLLHDPAETARRSAASRMRAGAFGLDPCVRATRAIHHASLRHRDMAGVAA